MLVTKQFQFSFTSITYTKNKQTNKKEEYFNEKRNSGYQNISSQTGLKQCKAL